MRVSQHSWHFKIASSFDYISSYHGISSCRYIFQVVAGITCIAALVLWVLAVAAFFLKFVACYWGSWILWVSAGALLVLCLSINAWRFQRVAEKFCKPVEIIN